MGFAPRAKTSSVTILMCYAAEKVRWQIVLASHKSLRNFSYLRRRPRALCGRFSWRIALPLNSSNFRVCGGTLPPAPCDMEASWGAFSGAGSPSTPPARGPRIPTLLLGVSSSLPMLCTMNAGSAPALAPSRSRRILVPGSACGARKRRYRSELVACGVAFAGNAR